MPHIGRHSALQIRIRLYGHLRAAFGLAGGAQATRRALEQAGCDVEPVDLALVSHPPLEPAEDPEPSLEPATVQVELVHTNPNVLTHTPGLLDPATLQAPIRIGYWAWELEQFPEGWQDHFRHFHEIWCPSSFSAQALAQRAPVPVVAVPHLPDWPRLDALYAKRQATPRAGQPFRFLTLFDYWSTPERKNPAGVIEAFQQAFPLGSGTATDAAPADAAPGATPAVELVIKTSSAAQFPARAAELRALTASDPRISWRDELLSSAQLDALLASAQALVSLHRAEGFGLVLAEAMGAAVPVIATGYSGNLEFCAPGSCCSIPWQSVAIPATAGDYPAGATWAEPDVDAAAQAMRQLAADPVAARALGERGRRVVRERLNPQRIAAIIHQRLGSHLLPPTPTAAAAG